MKIEHIAMYVHDLEGAKDFFTKYFNGSSNEKYYNPNTKFSSYFLSFEDGARLEIMNLPELEKSKNSNQKTGLAHLAFSVGSPEMVDILSLELQNAGFNVKSGPRTTGDGYYESCIVGFEGNLIEITT